MGKFKKLLKESKKEIEERDSFMAFMGVKADDYISEEPDFICDVSTPMPPNRVRDESSARQGRNIPQYMLFPQKGSSGYFIFGKARIDGVDYNVGKPEKRDDHIIIVGATGSGKTTGMITPSFDTLNGHVVTIDVKPTGRLLKECLRASKTMGKQVLVFNPLRNDSCGIDPYAFIRLDGVENIARNASDLAFALLPDPPFSTDPVWLDAARSYLAGVIVHHCDLGATFQQTMIAVQRTDVESMINELENGYSVIAKMFINNLGKLAPKTKASIGMNITKLAVLAADSRVSRALCSEEKNQVIDWGILNTSTEPCNIVLQIAQENLTVWAPMTRLIISQLIRTLMRRADKYTPEGVKLPPVFVELDEFKSLGELRDIISALATLRDHGVTVCICVQSLSQLDGIYGQEVRREIVDNCGYIAVLKVRNAPDQKEISEMIGTIKEPFNGENTIYNDEGMTTGYSWSVNETLLPIIFPHDLTTNNDVLLLTPEGFCRVEKLTINQNEEDEDNAIIC